MHLTQLTVAILLIVTISLAAQDQLPGKPNNFEASLDGIPACFINCFVTPGEPGSSRYNLLTDDRRKFCNHPLIFGGAIWTEKDLVPCAKEACGNNDFFRNAIVNWRQKMCPDCPNPACW